MNNALSNSVPRHVMARRTKLRMKAHEDMVYAAIKAAAEAGQYCPPSTPLGEKLGLSEATVRNVIRRLRDSRRLDVYIIRGRRVAELDTGLKTRIPPEGYSRKPKTTETRLKIPCLCCERPFWSRDRRSNRLCASCSGRSDPLPDVAMVAF